MRCKTCGKRVETRLTETDVMVDGKPIHVINIPAYHCAACNQDFFDDIVLRKAEVYARASQSNPLDYSGYEERESEDMLGHGIL